MYDNDQPTMIFVEKLTVTEHHEVSWDQDPKNKKKYDGFVLTREDGTIWHNQFPYASYGQLSTTADHVFNFYPNFSEEGEELQAKWLALFDNENNFPTEYESLTVNYQRLERGIREFTTSPDKFPVYEVAAQKLKQLNELRGNILKAFEEKFPTKQICEEEKDLKGYKYTKFVVKDK